MWLESNTLTRSDEREGGLFGLSVGGKKCGATNSTHGERKVLCFCKGFDCQKTLCAVTNGSPLCRISDASKQRKSVYYRHRSRRCETHATVIGGQQSVLVNESHIHTQVRRSRGIRGHGGGEGYRFPFPEG